VGFVSKALFGSSAPELCNMSYDRAITVFSPDGHLFQVEYAMEAASRGSTVACITLDLRPWFISHMNSTHNDVHPTFWTRRGKITLLVLVRETNKGIRHANWNTHSWTVEEEKIHRIDTNAVLVTTGLIGDSLALARTLRRMALNHRLSCGEASLSGFKINQDMEVQYHMDRSGGLGGPVCLETIARDCASLQHELTRTNGARPLGLNAILIGLDPFATSPFHIEGTWNAGEIRLFQSESGGLLEEYQFCTAGRGAARVQVELEKLWKELNIEISEMVEMNPDQEWKQRFEHCYESVIKRLVKDMGSMVLKNDGDNVGDELSNEKEDGRRKAVDLYMFNADTMSRGNLHMKCARDVLENELELVSALFAQ
jgi:20S proteasome alpha/beta subunit